MSNKEGSRFDLGSVSENHEIGYILECDLEYPKGLHDSHNGYPLCPEKIEVISNMLSKYCSDIANKCAIKIGGVKKLIPNLSDKNKYVVHYRNLQYYLSLGIKLIKVHRILKFKESNWLQDMLSSIPRKDKKVLMNLIKIYLSY